MRHLAAVLILALLGAGSSLALRPTFKMHFAGPDEAKVTAARDYLNGKLSEHSGRIILAISPVALNEDGMYEFGVFVQVGSRAAALALRDLIWSKRAQILANFHGRIVVHLCPAPGEQVEGWTGCDTDPRSRYAEITF